MPHPEPFTPVSNKSVSRVCPDDATAGSRGEAVHIPATPYLKKMGFGTGVSVFLYSRSPFGDKHR